MSSAEEGDGQTMLCTKCGKRMHGACAKLESDFNSQILLVKNVMRQQKKLSNQAKNYYFTTKWSLQSACLA